jgi:hypothetical protein
VFAFIKFVTGILEKFRSNKKLWLMLLSLTSFVVIIVAIYLLTFISQNSSGEIYKSMSKSYQKDIDLKLSGKHQEFKKVMISIKATDSFQDSVSKNNTPALLDYVSKANKGFLENGFRSLKLKYNPVKTLDSIYRNSMNVSINARSEMFGVELLTNGVFVTLLSPVISNDKVVGVLELQESIHSFAKLYKAEDSNFIFLANKKMLLKLPTDFKNDNFIDIKSGLSVRKSQADSEFAKNIVAMDSELFASLFSESGYVLDADYYKTYKEIKDINGVNLGYAVIGISLNQSGQAVNIVDKLTQSVTSVALGLVIAILLFMF